MKKQEETQRDLEILKQYPPIIEIELVEEMTTVEDASSLMNTIKKEIEKKDVYKDCLVVCRMGKQFEIKIHSVLKYGEQLFLRQKSRIEKIIREYKESKGGE